VADDQICGYRTFDLERDGLDLQAFLEDGQGHVNDSVRRALGLGEEVCAPMRFATEVAASKVVPGLTPALAPFRFFDVKLPGQVKGFMLAVSTVKHALEMPKELPRVGASSVQAPVAWTGGQGLWLNSGPGSGRAIKILKEGTVVSIRCQVRGRAVDAPNGRTDLWDEVVVADGSTGFVSDGWVNTGSAGQVSPSCQ